MNIRDFFGIIRELSFSEIRQEAMIPPRILVVSSSEDDASRWQDLLFGEDSAGFVESAALTGISVDPLAYDAIVSIGPLTREVARNWSDLFRRAGEEMALVELKTNQPSDDASLEKVRRQICDVCRDRSVAFGRYIETMRNAATAEIVADTSRVNAQFAAISNIPALIPVVGTMVAAGADFLVLTKNQLMMMYRLAAIYDRDLDDRWRVYAELAPVVGAGLFWRTVARQVAAVVPFALGAIPKVTIAYAGTYAVGRAAHVYYESGVRLSGDELDDVYREALNKLGNARHRIRGEVAESDEPGELPERVAPAQTGSE